MKNFLKEYINIIINILCAILFGLGFYNILINIFHGNYINETLVVGNLHSDYNKFQDNIVEIEKNLKIYNYDEEKFSYDMVTMETLRGKVSYCLSYLKSQDGLYGMGINTLVTSADLYNINQNFIQEITNQCWTLGMSFINFADTPYGGYFGDSFPRYSKTIDLLITNSKYVKTELLSNSSYHYATDTIRYTVRDDLAMEYDFIVRNYREFSDIILEISEYLVRGDNND